MTMMKTYEITSLTNEKIKHWAKLSQSKHRRTTGLFLAEGYHLVQEAAIAGLIDTLILVKGKQIDIEAQTIVEVTEEIMKKLCGTESQSDVVAVCRLWKQEGELGERVLLLDQLQDPGNVGTIIRTARSFGFDSVVLSENTVDLTNDKVIRSSQGAIFHIPVYQRNLLKTIDALKQNDIYILGTGLQDALPMSHIPCLDAVAIVVGNEGQGVRESVLKRCDAVTKIEIDGFESLNVAVAAGILCYHFRKG